MKTAVLLVNLGTPDSPEPKDVYRYLVEFLTDNRVIDAPWLQRQLLVRGYIIPSRYKQSAKAYASIWTKEGSPLLIHGKNVRDSLQNSLGEDFHVELAMRYCSPSIEQGLNNIFAKNIEHLIILPLFPQYASATTGSVHQKTMELLKGRNTLPKITFINSFANQPHFIDAICNNARKHKLEEYDHFIFSFHGLPQRHLRKADTSDHCLKSQDCCSKVCAKNRNCYSAQCHLTAASIISKLNLPPEKTTLTFQSRLGKDPWIEPFTLNVIEKLAEQNKKNMLVFSPSFVCDCLETTYEISIEYAEEFRKRGGKNLSLVSGLNDDPLWIEALKNIILSNNI
jgi:protoporphyrin/coproporphyrin ferrochelatase